MFLTVEEAVSIALAVKYVPEYNAYCMLECEERAERTKGHTKTRANGFEKKKF